MHTLVHLSDPHIVRPGRLLGDHVDTAAALARAVEAIGRLTQAPDAVLLSGDLVDAGDAQEYAHLRRLLAPLAAPVYLMPGNHDDRDVLRASFPDHAYLGAHGPVDYSVDVAGLRLHALDSVVPRAPHGALADAQLERLARALDASPMQPAIVALHHPPFDSGIAFMDAMALRVGTDALAALVRRHAQVERVLCGHVHRSIQQRWAGTIAMTAPSTAHQIHLDLRPGGAEAYTLEPGAFLLHAWEPGGPVVSHRVATAPIDGPYPFS